MATSPIYNWPEPDNTDLVKNGALAMRTLGDAIDTTMATMTPKSIVDAKGDLIAASAADTPARLAVGNNGETLVADSYTATGLRWQGDYAAGKNKIINGDFGIWQRGTTFTNPAIFSYTADRWQTIINGSPTFSVSRQTFTPGTAPVAGYEGSFFLRQNVTSATGASVIVMAQTVEDVRTLAGQTVTFSFWAKADAARTWSLNMDQVFGSGGSTSVRTAFGTISVTTSWQRFSVTAAIPSIAGKTIGTNSYLHVLIFGPGETVQTMDIWGVQVEAGSVATAFQTATGTIQGELAACQRYYYRAGGLQTRQPVAIGYAANVSTIYALVTFPETLRVAPTSVDYANLQADDLIAGAINFTGLTLTGNYGGNNMQWITVTGLSGLTARNPYSISSNGTTNGYLGFSAEL